MKKITIAFDVDWTLIKTWFNKDNIDTFDFFEDVNRNIANLLISLSYFKNVKIIVWSGQWEEWARQITKLSSLDDRVDWYASKNHKGKNENWKHIFEPDIVPDIAIDDIQACELWLINLIVKEK